MGIWLFQSNPDRYQVDEYVRQTDEVYWSVKHQSHIDQIENGDPAFLWRAQGSSNTVRGVIAKGVIFQTPIPKNELPASERSFDRLWVEDNEVTSEMKAGIRLDEKRLTPEEGMLRGKDLELHPLLAKMQILTSRQGTCFKLSPQQYEILASLWAQEDVFFEGGEGNYSGREGAVKYHTHKYRERDRGLVREAKRVFAQEHDGQLFCEICSFSFSDTYGELAQDYIEAHHKISVSEMEPDTEVSISDLMMVCANCHRVLHKGDSASQLAALLGLFSPV
jgi:predicted RNA-binding protein with PUA-like domain